MYQAKVKIVKNSPAYIEEEIENLLKDDWSLNGPMVVSNGTVYQMMLKLEKVKL